MYLTVEIRGAAKLVRHRNGEELSDPVMEFEEGSEAAQPQPIARHITRGNPEGFYASMLDRNAPTQLSNPQYQAIGSAAGASTGEGFDESDRDSDHSAERRPHERLGAPDQGELLRLFLDRPRRFLRRLYAESKRRGPLTVRFTRPLATGRAVLDISAHGRDCVARALLEVAPARSATSGRLQAKHHRSQGFVAVALELDADLRPDGSLDRVSSHWRTRGLTLTSKEAKLLHRFARAVTRIADDPGTVEARRSRLGRVLSTWLAEHPEWGVALVAQLVERLEALPLTPSARQRRKDRGPPSMDEILAGLREPGTDELMLGAPPPPGLQWLDDRRPKLLLPEAGQSNAAMLELNRLACIIPMILDRLD